jgi:predicted component of type VI protein secretion system
MAAQLQQVTSANQTFARGKNDPGLSRKLASSERTMRTLRQRLGKVTAPPQAQHLRTLLLRLVDGEIELAQEVRQLAAFVPRYRVALQPLQPASTALQKKLAAGAKGTAATKALNAAKADQLTAYAGTVASVTAAVRPLDPPPVWQPTYRQQLFALTHLQASALALASAVRRNDATAIPGLLRGFDAAAISTQTVAAQKREIAAVKAYNGRIETLARLARSVATERARLEKRYR